MQQEKTNSTSGKKKSPEKKKARTESQKSTPFKKHLKEVKEEIPKEILKSFKSKIEKIQAINANLGEMTQRGLESSEDDDLISTWLETQISDLEVQGRMALQVLSSEQKAETSNLDSLSKLDGQVSDMKDDSVGGVSSIISDSREEIRNVTERDRLYSENDPEIETSYYSTHFVDENKSIDNMDSLAQGENSQKMSPLGQLVLLHERRMNLTEERMNKVFELLDNSKIESGSFSKRLDFLSEKIDNFKPPMKESDILALVNKAVDARILNLMENGILYSAVDHKARVNAQMGKLPKLAEILNDKKEDLEEMVNDTAEALVGKAIGQLNQISPAKVEGIVELIVKHSGGFDSDDESFDGSSTLSSIEERNEVDEEDEMEMEIDSQLGTEGAKQDLSNLPCLYDYACQLPQPQIPQLPIPLDSRLAPVIIHYNSTYQPYYEACYRELNNFCRNVKNSRYHNIFYPLENIKIQISIKTPNFQKSVYCEGEGCVIACAGKNDFLAVQNWKGLALVTGGKIVSDFCEEEVRGRGWKDVVFLEKGNIWDTWARNRARLGSGVGLFMRGKSKSKRRARLSNRSVGGKKSTKRRRRERLSNTSTTHRVARKERLSNRSSGGTTGIRGERLSNRSDNMGSIGLTMANNPPAEGLSASSVGEQQIYKKGFYYLYDHMEKGIFRRDLGPNSQPQKLMAFSGSSMTGRVIRVGLNEFSSEDHLVLNQTNENLVYLDVQNLQKFDIIPRGEFYENLYIWDFQTLSDNRVAILTNSGFMILLKYFPETKTTFILSEFQLDLAEQEEAYCMAVCPKSKVICVNISREKSRLSRLVVFEVDDDYLQKKDEMSFLNEHIEDIKTMEFYDYFQDKLILTALTGNEPLTMFGFLYDGVNLREFVQRKVLSDLQMTYRLSRIEGGAEGLVTADLNWNLIQIKYKC